MGYGGWLLQAHMGTGSSVEIKRKTVPRTGAKWTLGGVRKGDRIEGEGLEERYLRV